MRRTKLWMVVPDTDETASCGPHRSPFCGVGVPVSLACASWRMQMTTTTLTTRHRSPRCRCAGRARKDGNWLCTPVDPGSSPGTGPKVV